MSYYFNSNRSTSGCSTRNCNNNSDVSMSCEQDNITFIEKATITQTGGGSGSTISAFDESVLLTSTLTGLNFVGDSVTATNAGGIVTVSIADSARSLTISNSGAPITTEGTLLNFEGFTVTESIANEVTITAIPVDLTGITSSLSSIQSQVDSNDTDILNLNTSLTSISNDVATNAGDVTTLQSGLSATDSNVSSVTTNVNTLATDLASLDTDLISTNTSLTAIDNRVTTNEADILVLQNTDDFISVFDEGTNLSNSVSSLNFTGNGVIATESNGTVTVDITGATNGASVDDSFFSVGWGSDTLNAPSRNAVYDKFIQVDQNVLDNFNEIQNNISFISDNIDDIATLTTRVSTNEADITALQNAGTGGGTSDLAYDSSWNGVTNLSPSQNAVYDKIESIDSLITTNTNQISQINAANTSQDNLISNLNSAVNNTNSVATTNGNNITNLTSRVDDAETDITTNASDITVLQSAPPNLETKDEGSLITSAPSEINFTGAGVTASSIGSVVTVDIPGGGGGGGGIASYVTATCSTPITISGNTPARFPINTIEEENSGQTDYTLSNNAIVVNTTGVYKITASYTCSRIHRGQMTSSLFVGSLRVCRISLRGTAVNAAPDGATLDSGVITISAGSSVFAEIASNTGNTTQIGGNRLTFISILKIA